MGFGVQEKMLNHQHESQLKMLVAEKDRAIAQMTTQYDQQYMQQKLAIEQAYNQQHSQLAMAKMQREMAIQQQAAQMTATAKQYEMQVEMQKQMASAYGSRVSPCRVPPALRSPPPPRAHARVEEMHITSLWENLQRYAAVPTF